MNLRCQKHSNQLNKTLNKGFLSLLHYYPSPAWVRSINGEYLWVNKGFLKFFNISSEEIINKSNKDLYLNNIMNMYTESDKDIFEKKLSITFSYDEKKYRANIYKTPIFNRKNKLVALAALMTDLTSTREIEVKLNQANNFHQSILDNMEESLIFVNMKGDFEIINKKGQDFLKKIGFYGSMNFDSWYEFFLTRRVKDPEKRLVKNNEIIPKALRGEKTINQEVTMLTKNNTHITFRASAIPFMDQDNNVILGAIITATDITHEKQILQYLKNSKQLIENRNEELHHFAHCAAHDLRDPLRSISLTASIMEKNLQEKNYKEIPVLLKRLLKATKYGGALVQNLLNYSSANQEAHLSEVYLKDIIDNNTEILKEIVTEADATINYGNLPSVIGNSQQLQIVFQNLITNAIYYSKKLSPPIITISAAKKTSFWEISVQDNGSGIDKQYHEVIFHPFKRLKANKDSRSTGLGLSICRRIIEHHGGKIWIESQKNEGATFKFLLKSIP